MDQQKYLQQLERKFLNISPLKPASVATNVDQIESVGGVYAIWEGKKIRYFGETCHLNHRLGEILIIGRHHSLNLLMGEKAQGMTGRERSAWLCKSIYRVSWMVVNIGRAEFEEYMVLKYARTLKNHQGGRFCLRSDFTTWQTMIKPPNQKPDQTGRRRLVRGR